MFARILAFEVKSEKKEEFVKAVKEQVLPILRKQVGFLESLPFFQKQGEVVRVFTISLWTTCHDAERYEREFYPQVAAIIGSFALTPVEVSFSNLETSLCDQFVDALAV